MQWVSLTTDLLMADFPTDLRPLYENWASQFPEKVGRLAQITARVVAEFRDAIVVNPENSLDPDELTIPESCIRSAETMVFYNLMMEMGLSIKQEAQESMTRAEIFLRQISYKHFRTAGTSADQRAPHYMVPDSDKGRALP
jgi:hypothetical protein